MQNNPLAAEHPVSSLKRLAAPCLRSAFFVLLVTGMAYPLLTTFVARLLSEQASGSLIRKDGVVIGSRLIGQDFSQARYFHPRPSSTLGPDPLDPGRIVNVPYHARASAGSNLGPTNAALIDAVRQRAAAFRRLNGLPADAPVPVDAVTASASGLDPQISIANAQLQTARVARERGLTVEQVQALLGRHIEGRLFGVLGQPRVNVLELNLALDARTPSDGSSGAKNQAGERHAQ
ncbi:potassium-transporting ATPase subunit KdpC [Castellaniella sp. WN]